MREPARLLLSLVEQLSNMPNPKKAKPQLCGAVLLRPYCWASTCWALVSHRLQNGDLKAETCLPGLGFQTPQRRCVHLVKNMRHFPLLVFTGIYHYWKVFFPRRLNQTEGWVFACFPTAAIHQFLRVSQTWLPIW